MGEGTGGGQGAMSHVPEGAMMKLITAYATLNN